jgi:hypothetical protein
MDEHRWLIRPGLADHGLGLVEKRRGTLLTPHRREV